jgi:predicted dehydrogenase
MLGRRDFLRSAAAFLPAASYARAAGANDRLRIASVGTGGRGWADLAGATAPANNVEVAALCDIDESEPHLGRAAAKWPSAARFTDWRKLFDKPAGYDAVIVSTPDHMHAAVALPAMALGKHVYCQKPLAHTVHEARQMRLAAEKAGVATQMGNQVQSSSAYRTATKAVQSGVVGKVKEVHSWQAGGMKWLPATPGRPAGADPVPAGVHWDDWLGVAPARPYKEKIYHAFNWRGWQDFSTGQIGDFACHILDPVFTALGLTAPTAVRAEASPLDHEVWYTWSVVRYEFPGTAVTGPTVAVTWYDGEGKYPPREKLGVAADFKLPTSGSVIVGEKASLLVPHGGAQMPVVLAGGKPAGVTLEAVPAVDHYGTWAAACRGGGKAGSNFGYSGPLTETVLLGSVAIRVHDHALTWDAAGLTIPNNRAANDLIHKEYRKGWEPKWVG